MILNGWQIVIEAYEKYSEAGVAQLLLISAIVLLLIKSKKSENKHLAYYIITLAIIISLPPVAFLFVKYIDNVYWRIFWLIPSVIVIAFVATKLIEQTGKKSKGRIEFIAICLLIVVGGKCMYNAENFTKSTNQYKLPQEAVDICEMVTQDGTTKIIVPETLISYIRQCNPNIEMLYGRNLAKDVKKGKNYKFLLQLNSADPDIQVVAEYAKSQSCEYVVFENTSNGIESMENYGYQIFGNTENYTVFRNIE